MALMSGRKRQSVGDTLVSMPGSSSLRDIAKLVKLYIWGKEGKIELGMSTAFVFVNGILRGKMCAHFRPIQPISGMTYRCLPLIARRVLIKRAHTLHFGFLLCVFISIPQQNVPVWSLSSTAECFLVQQKPSPGLRACRLRHRSPLPPAPPGNNPQHCHCRLNQYS